MASFARWWMTLLGGVMVGIGLLLYGQVHVAESLRNEVKDTFFLYVWIGKVTFVYRNFDQQTALVLHKVPDRYMLESRNISLTLMVVGGVLAAFAPFVRQRRRRSAM